MEFIMSQIMALLAGCVFLQQPVQSYMPEALQEAPQPYEQTVTAPTFTGSALDVVLSADSALVWDMESGAILFEKNADKQRPIASITKLLSTLYVRQKLSPETIVEIPSEVRIAQITGANIKLPIGQHASVQNLLAASLIPSANDAMVSLAHAASGSEATFVEEVNSTAVPALGLKNTHVTNATGLSSLGQYSTAHDVRIMITRAYNDPLLRSFLAEKNGVLTTVEGARRAYETTNDLLGTYLPILAAKTGYTVEAGQNLTILTQGDSGQKIGVVILGSEDRFQDTKILTEWIWRNYTWSAVPADGTL